MSTTETHCVAASLSDDEIAVIAEYERLGIATAAPLGDSLLAARDGAERIKRLLLDSLEAATQRGHFDEASRLALLYRRFTTDR